MQQHSLAHWFGIWMIASGVVVLSAAIAMLLLIALAFRIRGVARPRPRPRTCAALSRQLLSNRSRARVNKESRLF
jgi:hypothetical protein